MAGTTEFRNATYTENLLVFEGVDAMNHGGIYSCSADNGIRRSTSNITVIGQKIQIKLR